MEMVHRHATHRSLLVRACSTSDFTTILPQPALQSRWPTARRQLGLAASIHRPPRCNQRTLEAEKVERVCMDRSR
eukprot:4745586-Prymnesium_polylepis.1